MSEALKRIENFRIQVLQELYDQCTEKQQELFNRIFTKGINKMPRKDIDGAIELCERTIIKNNKQKQI